MLDHNVPSQFIANIDSPAQVAALVANSPAAGAAPAPADGGAPPQSAFPYGPQGVAAHSQACWIKLSAQSDGTFTVSHIAAVH